MVRQGVKLAIYRDIEPEDTSRPWRVDVSNDGGVTLELDGSFSTIEAALTAAVKWGTDRGFSVSWPAAELTMWKKNDPERK